MCTNKTYNHTKKHCELKRKLEMLDKDHKDLMTVLDSFNGKIVLPINKDDLSKFPLLEWVELNDKVRIRKRNNYFGVYLNFDTEMKKGGEFGKHFHQDIIENAEVIKGKMLDRENNQVYGVHDIMHYEKNQHHTPIALEDTLLKVIFKP